MASNGTLDQPTQSSKRVHSGVFWISAIVSLGFGVLWIIAGVLKVKDPALFLMDVRSFQMLGDPWAAYLALCLPWLVTDPGSCNNFRDLKTLPATMPFPLPCPSHHCQLQRQGKIPCHLPLPVAEALLIAFCRVGTPKTLR